MMKIFHILFRMTVLLMAFVMVSCMEKDNHDPEERLVTLQVSLDVKTPVKAESADVEKTINSIRIYAYRADSGTQVGHYFRGVASTEPIYIDLSLPQRGQYDIDFYIIVNETSVQIPDDFVFTERLSADELSQARFT